MGQGLAQLSDQFDPLQQVELGEMLGCPTVQRLLAQHPVEQHRRAAISAHQVGDRGDAVVMQALQQPHLALGLALQALFLLARGGGTHQVGADAAAGAQARPGALEVLPARAFVEQFTDLPVARLAAAVHRLQASRVDGVGDAARHRLVDRRRPGLHQRWLA